MSNQYAVRRALVDSAGKEQAGGDLLGRALDIGVALAAAVFLAPIVAIAATLIALERRGPILFRHERIGRGGKAFLVYKFRTMLTDADMVLERHLAEDAAARAEWAADHKLRKDPRVSRLGFFLRATSIDEIPQLLNVLRGEMSIVGPRPITLAEVGRYGAYYSCYCSVRPGITGVWQVSGRNNISYQRRVEMDALYARRKSVLFDLKLIAATIPAVLSRRGSY